MLVGVSLLVMPDLYLLKRYPIEHIDFIEEDEFGRLETSLRDFPHLGALAKSLESTKRPEVGWYYFNDTFMGLIAWLPNIQELKLSPSKLYA
jgi:hypothetical protein